MVYEVLKCPNCKHKYEERAQGTTKYRSPFLHCTKCHETFVDQNSFEPALFSPQHLEETHKKDSIKGGIYLAFITAFFLIGCIATSFKNVPFIIMFAFAALLWVIILACGSANNSGDVNIQFMTSYIISLRNLCELEYAQRLKSLGFSVPSIYLDPNCELLSEIRRLRSEGDNATPELNDLYNKIRNNPSILQ